MFPNIITEQWGLCHLIYHCAIAVCRSPPSGRTVETARTPKMYTMPSTSIDYLTFSTRQKKIQLRRFQHLKFFIYRRCREPRLTKQNKSLICIMKSGLDAMPLFLLDDLLNVIFYSKITCCSMLIKSSLKTCLKCFALYSLCSNSKNLKVS